MAGPGHAPLLIARGRLAAIRGCPAFAPSPITIVLDPGAGFPVPWGGLRALLPPLRARLGDLAVARAVAPHRAALGLVLRRLDVSLTPAEREQRRELAASTASFVARDRRSSAPLRDAWTSAIGALLEQAPIRIAIPDPAAIDRDSLSILTALLRREPALAGVALGQVVDPVGRESALAALDAAERIDVDGDREDPGPAGIEIDSLDDDLERRAWTALTIGSAIDRKTGELGLTAARAAFAAFGFAAAGRIAGELCGRRASLAPADAHEAFLLAAVAASGEQTDQAIAELLSAALMAGSDPTQRSRILSRLARLQGSERAELEHGADLATEAIRLAAEPAVDPDVRGMVEAWALHARALTLADLGRLPEAIGEATAAIEALGRAKAGLALPARELALSEIALADVAADLCWRDGDQAAAHAWQAVLERAEIAHDGHPRLARRRWIAIERAEHHLDRAIAHAEAAVERAVADLDPAAEEELTALLGELLYCAGEPIAAARRRARVAELRRRVGGAAEIAAAEIDAAMASWRAGHLDDADRWLDSALSSDAIVPTARPELVAARAMIAAEAGDDNSAEVLLDEAIGLAADSGVRAILVAVALASGDASQHLGEPEVAESALDRARQIAAAAREPMPPRVAIRLWLGSDDPADLSRAVDSLAAGLDGDPELWWLIRPVLEAVAGAIDAGASGLDSASLELVERAGSVRTDCAEPLDRLARRRQRR